jgi:hypothetical protein
MMLRSGRDLEYKDGRLVLPKDLTDYEREDVLYQMVYDLDDALGRIL